MVSTSESEAASSSCSMLLHDKISLNQDIIQLQLHPGEIRPNGCIRQRATQRRLAEINEPVRSISF